MDPKNPLDKGVLTVIAALASDLASTKKIQLEILEAFVRFTPAFRDAKTVALLSELEQSLATAQKLSDAAEQLKASLKL